MKSVFLFLSVLTLTSCGNGKKSGPQDKETLDGEFKLTQVGNEDLSSEDFYFEFVDQEKIMFGNTGCNGLSANYTIEDSQISFTAPVSTRKFCEGKMETEQQIHAAMEETLNFRRDGKNPLFFSQENDPLISLTKTAYSE